jgi:ABC-2 type transport system ATP-binding protein
MLKLKDIELSFPNKKHVLNDITLTLDQKEVVGLVAPNGTGKTTLLNVIMNNLTPSHGYVEIDGLRYDNNRLTKKFIKRFVHFLLKTNFLVS